MDGIEATVIIDPKMIIAAIKEERILTEEPIDIQKKVK